MYKCGLVEEDGCLFYMSINMCCVSAFLVLLCVRAYVFVCMFTVYVCCVKALCVVYVFVVFTVLYCIVAGG